MLDIDTPFVLYVPGWAVWSHPHLRWWAAWLRAHGYRGWLPPWAVTDCRVVWPAQVCACRMYFVFWE